MKNKKHYYLIVDTETTQKNTVADFGAVVMDRQGNIIEQFGVLLDGHFGSVELFHDKKAPSESFWSTMMLHRRKKNYDQLLDNGQRSICSPCGCRGEGPEPHQPTRAAAEGAGGATKRRESRLLPSSVSLMRDGSFGVA